MPRANVGAITLRRSCSPSPAQPSRVAIAAATSSALNRLAMAPRLPVGADRSSVDARNVADCATVDGGAQVVVGIAIVDGNRLLAAQRSEPPALAGFWELPGGKVDAGETDEA